MCEGVHRGWWGAGWWGDAQVGWQCSEKYCALGALNPQVAPRAGEEHGAAWGSGGLGLAQGRSEVGGGTRDWGRKDQRRQVSHNPNGQPLPPHPALSDATPEPDLLQLRLGDSESPRTRDRFWARGVPSAGSTAQQRSRVRKPQARPPGSGLRALLFALPPPPGVRVAVLPSRTPRSSHASTCLRAPLRGRLRPGRPCFGAGTLRAGVCGGAARVSPEPRA